MSAAATSGERMRSLVLRGVGWKFASQTFLQLSRIVIGVVLARLLTPHDYGLAAMALVFSSLVLVFSDLALGAALVQRRTLSEQDRSTVFWTGLGAGLTFTLIGVGLSWPLAWAFGEPDVQPLFAALSLSFLVNSLGTTQKALLTREMNFRSVELRLIVGTLGGGLVGIALAARGFGPWAIIGQQLALAALATALLWLVSPWRPRLTFSGASLRRLGGFSGNVLGTRLFYYLHENAASLLIGRFLGAGAFGLFSVAYTIILTPFSRIAIPVGEVLFPAFSRLQDEPERVARMWVRGIRILAALCVPATAGVVIVAPELVRVLLGERWEDAVPVLQILAWVGLLQALQSWNGGILMALDRARTLFRYTVVFFAVHVVAFAVGLQWGIVGVAAAYAVSTTLLEPPYLWLTARAAGMSPWLFVRALAGVVQASLIMAAALLVARFALVQGGFGAAARLAIMIGLGAAVFVPACLWRAPEVLEELRDLRRRRGARRTVVETQPSET
jgi:O-antigen/teichoic acid export membrane protein